ncbi:MAG: glycosyl hydrolase, partial [Bacteroidetes bacterium]
QPFEILKDPRSPSSPADFQKQFEFLIEVRDKLSEAHQAITDIRSAREQIQGYLKRLPEDSTYNALREKGKAIVKALTQVEEALYQTKNESRQDPLNFPIRLTNKLGHLNSLVGMGDFPPTEQDIAVKNELTAQIDAELARFHQVLESDIPEFNRLAREAAIDAVIVK